MFANNLYVLSLFLLFFYLAFAEATKMVLNNTMINSTSTINMTHIENVTTIETTKKTLFIQGQELIHDSFHKMNRSTLLWSTIALATIASLISIYVAIKTFVLRKNRQTRRYKLLSNATTTMEEPLFNGHDDDEEEDERDDDTLFVRK